MEFILFIVFVEFEYNINSVALFCSNLSFFSRFFSCSILCSVFQIIQTTQIQTFIERIFPYQKSGLQHLNRSLDMSELNSKFVLYNFPFLLDRRMLRILFWFVWGQSFSHRFLVDGESGHLKWQAADETGLGGGFVWE